MDKEGFFISNFKNSVIGDDGAIIKNLIYSKDLFCEDIHFKTSWMSLFNIAKKSMLVNISDAIAMNAKPLYALIGIVIPSSFSYKQLKELSNGFLHAAKQYNLQIIGGDTTSGDKLMISITIISKSKNPLKRDGLRVGDFVAYSGKLGDSKRGLTKLLRGGKINSKNRFITPSLKSNFIYKARKYLSSGLDISDGLSKDLSRLSGKKFGVKFLKKIPKNILCSGEEYEMLFTFAPKNLPKIKAISKKTRTPITVFAKICRGRYSSTCKENHFKTIQ
jgi:thiamine-monophosphate kinase